MRADYVSVDESMVSYIFTLEEENRMRADYVSVDESMVSYIFYLIKQDFRICVPYSRPNGWTEWADIFCRQSWVPWE